MKTFEGKLVSKSIKVGIVAARFNEFITSKLIGGAMDGLDALLATVQMPKGIPVATVAIDGADNAAYLAVQMLALSDAGLAQQLDHFKQKMTDEVMAKNENLQKEVEAL